MSIEHSYSLLTPLEQATELARLTEEMWNMMDKLAAITAGRAALMNVMMAPVIGEELQ